MRWLRVVLIVVAVVCFGVALSYPIRYRMAQESNNSNMEQLSALRAKGQETVGKATSSPEIPAEGDARGEETGEAEGAATAPSGVNEGTAEAKPDHAAPNEAQETAKTGQITAVEVQETAKTEQTTAVEAQETAKAEQTTVVVEAQETAKAEQTTVAVEAQVTAETDQVRSTEAPETAEAASEAMDLAAPDPSAEGWETTEGVNADLLEAAQTGSAEMEEAVQAVQVESQEAVQADQTKLAEAEHTAELTQTLPRETQELIEKIQAISGEAPSEETQTSGPMEVKAPEPEETLAASEGTSSPTPEPSPTPTPGLMDLILGFPATPTPRPTATPTPTADVVQEITPEPSPTPNRRVHTGALPYPMLEKVELDLNAMLPELEEIYALNHDLVGWITIPDTVIDYPVVQCEDSEFYLSHDFYGEENVNGQIILDTLCDPYTPSYNLVISGHHMKNGSMFGDLPLYATKGYWERHKLLEFDTLMARKQYVIFAAFYSADYDEDEEGFRYNANIQYALDADQWLAEVRENQLYDTEIDVEFGDEFITLTTCNRARHRNGRFVVVCRKIREGETFE